MTPSYFSLGVTGHRTLEDADDKALEKQIDKVLRHIKRSVHSSSPARNFQLLSPLAEGADRLVARIALGLGYRLRCIFPLSKDNYMNDFETQDSKEEFRTLLAKAESVLELTGFERPFAYTAAGRQVIGESDTLMALWNGKEARGEGGTAQIVREALEQKRHVIWLESYSPHRAYNLSLHNNMLMTEEVFTGH
jgi:hypothetical protein